MSDDLDDVRLRHRMHARRAEWSDLVGYAAHRDRGVLLAKVDELVEGVAKQVPALMAEIDRLAEVLRSIAYEGGACLAVEGGAVRLDLTDGADEPCGVCAVCWARQALEGGAA